MFTTKTASLEFSRRYVYGTGALLGCGIYPTRSRHARHFDPMFSYPLPATHSPSLQRDICQEMIERNWNFKVSTSKEIFILCAALSVTEHQCPRCVVGSFRVSMYCFVTVGVGAGAWVCALLPNCIRRALKLSACVTAVTVFELRLFPVWR